MKYSIMLPVLAVPKGRQRFGKGRVFTPPKTARYEARLKMLFYTKFKNQPLEGPVWACFQVDLVKPKRTKNEYPSVRPDFDNYLKSICDAGNGVLWKDDSQIVSGAFKFRYAETAMIKIDFGILETGSEISLGEVGA